MKNRFKQTLLLEGQIADRVGIDKSPITTTPLKTNMSPENEWLEDVFPTEIVPFQGTC